MINNNIHAQNLESSKLIFGENHISETKKNFSAYVDKVTSIDIRQVKSYLGLVYFTLVSLLSITLLI